MFVWYKRVEYVQHVLDLRFGVGFLKTMKMEVLFFFFFFLRVYLGFKEGQVIDCMYQQQAVAVEVGGWWFWFWCKMAERCESQVEVEITKRRLVSLKLRVKQEWMVPFPYNLSKYITLFNHLQIYPSLPFPSFSPPTLI